MHTTRTTAHQAPSAPRWLVTLIVGLLAGLAASYLALDASAGVSLSPWPGLIFGAAGAAPGLLVAVWGRSRAAMAATVVYLALISAAPALDVGPRKPFLRAASAVAPGMSVADVDARMRGFARTPSEPGALDQQSGAVVYVNPFGPGDLDGVTVRFIDGRVVERTISYD